MAEETTPKTPAKHTRSVAAWTTDAAAVVASVATGVVGSKLYMEEKTNNSFALLGGYDEVKKSGKEAFAGIIERHKKGELTREQAAKEVAALSDHTNAEAAKVLDQVGGIKGGFKGMGEQWSHLRKYQKLQTLAFGAAAASIMLGGILMVAQRISDRHRDIESQSR
jgi:hypothetical protein